MKKPRVDKGKPNNGQQEVAITCQTRDSLPLEKIQAFQGDLKSLSKPEFEKLKKSIIKYGLSFPSFIWKKNGTMNCIDGHQRGRVLSALEKGGSKISPAPV